MSCCVYLVQEAGTEGSVAAWPLPLMLKLSLPPCISHELESGWRRGSISVQCLALWMRRHRRALSLTKYHSLGDEGRKVVLLCVLST